MEEWTRAQGELDTRRLLDALTEAGVNPEYILWVESELKRLVDEKENLKD